MRDSNQMIHYLGFQCTADGGRQLRFSVEKPSQTSVLFAITISGSFFTGPERISFQEAAGICRTKLRQNLNAGTLDMSSMQIELTGNDVAQYREPPKGRRRA